MALLANHSHTDRIVESAKKWAATDGRVQALVLYGSVHRQQIHQHSDVDLVIIGHEGRREQLWQSRHEVAATLLGQTPAWSHTLDWQGPYRFQAWTPSLAAVDLTFDDSDLEQHDVLADGYTVLYGTVDNRTKHASAATGLEQGGDLDGETWLWLLGLHGWLLHGRCWDVFTGLVQLLDTRLRPLIEPTDLEVLTAVAPRGSEPTALLHALQATTDLYDRLSQNHRPGLPRMVLADKIRSVISWEPVA